MRSQTLADLWIGLAVAVLLATVPTDTTRGGHLDAIGLLLVAVAGTTVAVHRRWPVTALAASLAVTVVFLSLHYPEGPIFALPAAAMYATADRRPARVSILAGAAAVAGYLAFMRFGRDESVVTSVVATAALLALPWVLGLHARTRREARDHNAADELRRAVYEERLQIAREVHDVLAHSLAVISMQAGVGLHLLPARPEQAEASLRAIRGASRTALDELRATLATFSPAVPATASPAAPGAGPAPGLPRVGELAEAMTGGGLPVALEVTGERGPVAASVDLAGYRIVQESLTNVARHAGAGRATVRVEYLPDTIRLTITDDGHGTHGALGHGSGGHGGGRRHTGRGLAGMTERARALGGTLTAGPRAGGGFEVHAVLPLIEQDPRLAESGSGSGS